MVQGSVSSLFELTDMKSTVVMELLDDSWPPLSCVNNALGRQTLRPLILSLVQQMHTECMVHGDLREENFMMKGNEESLE